MKYSTTAKTTAALQHSKNSTHNVYHITIKDIEGNTIDLQQYQGHKKLLFVNVASKCGFTKQYKELQQLYERYQDQLLIIGVPCNQFGKQEPGTTTEIQSFCERNYGVTFLITEKIDVKGKTQHPLYTWLTKKEYNGKKNSSVKWNFQKYLVNEQGQLIDYYFSITSPNSTKITKHL